MPKKKKKRYVEIEDCEEDDDDPSDRPRTSCAYCCHTGFRCCFCVVSNLLGCACLPLREAARALLMFMCLFLMFVGGMIGLIVWSAENSTGLEKDVMDTVLDWGKKEVFGPT